MPTKCGPACLRQPHEKKSIGIKSALRGSQSPLLGIHLLYFLYTKRWSNITKNQPKHDEVYSALKNLVLEKGLRMQNSRQ